MYSVDIIGEKPCQTGLSSSLDDEPHLRHQKQDGRGGGSAMGTAVFARLDVKAEPQRKRHSHPRGSKAACSGFTKPSVQRDKLVKDSQAVPASWISARDRVLCLGEEAVL